MHESNIELVGTAPNYQLKSTFQKQDKLRIYRIRNMLTKEMLVRKS